jgi:sarcosine oxidase subunit delta
MLLIPCPFCGDRAEIEFNYAGEAHRVRPREPEALSDEAWAGYLYARSNSRGPLAERWRHVHGCGRFFNAVRDTVTDIFECSYAIDAAPPFASDGDTGSRQ